MDPDGIDQGNKLRTVAHALRQSMRHDDLLGPVDRRLRVVALDEAVLGQEPAGKLRCTLGSGSFEGGRGTGPQRLRFSALRFSSAVCWQKNPQNATETKAPQSRSKPRVQGVIAGLLTI